MLDMELKSVKPEQRATATHETSRNPTFAEIHERHQQRIENMRAESEVAREAAVPEFHTINLEEPAPPAGERQAYIPNLWAGVKRRLSDTWENVVNRSTVTGAPSQ